jgi:diguanylate cyclase (GGDEF)-like protein
MRTITGWRFLVYIAMPLVLASLGAINLSYDLLRRVEAGSDQAEHLRNKTVLTEAINSLETDLSRLVTENAQWDEAVKNTSNAPDLDWFKRTWGSTLSMGVSYDVVALLDAKTGAVLIGNTDGKSFNSAELLFGNLPLSSFNDMLDTKNVRRGVVSGFLQTPTGPVVLAMAPIMSPVQLPEGNGRILYFGRKLKSTWFDGLQRQLLIGGLTIDDGAVGEDNTIALKSPDGQNLLHLRWRDRQLGDIVTASSWSKAGLILGFLIMVMTGIGYACWRLVQQLVVDEGKAQHNALHDHLTALPNRLALTQEMQKLYAEGKPYALAFADLDGFKEVNDSYGHEFGDRLIYMVANGIRQLTSHAQLSSRLGGDEFVVLFAGNHAGDEAKVFAANLIAMLKHPFDMDGRLASVGASIGIAECDGKLDVVEMLRRSDIAMYKAKANGKNRHCVFDEMFDAERIENLAIASELKSIIASRNLDIAFQPVVNAKTSEITGLEALARWPSTSLRKVTADKFITIAETSGLIDALGEVILDKACAAAAHWPDIRLAVNISAVQLNNPSFVARSLAIVERYGIPLNRMEFEITETSLIHDTERAKHVFKELQSAGVKVALDDFGTGFSSIGYLRTFQFDRIKIDKSIVSKVLSSASELAVVQGTLLVARGLSADVTAEGVESAEQASVLRLAGCTELQGFHYHRPLSATDVTETLRKSKVAQIPRSVMVS